MKKNLCLATSIVAMGAVLFTAGVSAYATQTIDGREDGNNQATVPVNGILGEFDNTTPGPDPADTDQWINVTLPTTALFYSDSNDVTNLVGPNYTITNNSAKKVEVYVEDVEDIQSATLIDELLINTIELIDSGTKSTGLDGTDLLFILDDNSNSTGAVNNFSLSGEASGAASLSSEVNPSFNLVLKFVPIIS